jgi:type II secretory ATPase GspE/PulE/Tfp pilus assembly ATPase PilB-like protein/ActR/RegA family two-component response regulator
MAGKHWLKTVAVRSGVPGAEALALEPGMPVPAAWDLVCRTLGIDEATLGQHVARHYRLRVADFTSTMANALRLVPESVVRKHMLLPLRENDREIYVATCDPTDIAAEQAVGFASGRAAVFEVTGPSTLRSQIDGRYGPDQEVQPLLRQMEAPAAASAKLDIASSQTTDVDLAHAGESGAVGRLTNLILRSAVEQEASLIEIAPGRSGGSVGFSVDGVMRHFMHLPLMAMNHVVSRIKVLGRVGFGARARSQDGAAQLTVDGRPYELRISILPAGIASKATIRIAAVDWKPRLAQLGFSDDALARLRALFDARNGLILIAGAPGGGRTTTLYAAVRDLVAGGHGVATVEDPAELELDGIAQHTVDRRTGATPAATLRDVLTTAPAVIALGDANDPETLRTAADAATERLVIAVVAADTPVDAVQRLVGASVRPETAARVLRGVVALRLLRRVCDACARPAAEPFSAEEIRLERAYGVAPARRAVGCARCGQSGYRGVVPIAQVMLVTPRLAGLIAIGAPPAQLEQVAIDGGMRTLLAAAQTRVAAGWTTLQEVERTLGARIEAAATPAPLHALVADDDPETILLATAVLEQEGLRCIGAADGIEALARLGDGREFALVLLDLNMPRLDGRETLRRLKSSASTAGLPVVVLTGSQDPADEIQVMEDGAADYIRKPIDPPRFLARVRAALRRHAGERAGAT